MTSEKINSFSTNPESPERHASREIIDAAFASIGAELSDHVDDRGMDVIRDKGAELIDQFGIGRELFDSKVSAFLFAAIAKRASELTADDREGHEFVADATMLLALEHSDKYSALKSSIDADKSDAVEQAMIYEKFTNPELTKDVEQAISNGLLNNVRERLGVNDDNEDPYEIKVLDLSDEYSLMGLKPSMPREYSELEMATYEEQLGVYQEYETKMLANLDAFRAEIGTEGRIPPAWNATVNGKKVLCIPNSTAKMLIDRETIKSRSFSRIDEAGENSDEARLLALVEHEYAHTQGNMTLGDNVFYGITAEEVRVENASGNKHGYMDAKIFMRQVAVLGGFNATEYFDANGRDSGEHFFMDMASKVGMDAALEIALVPPMQYVEDTRVMHKAVNEYLGGYNGVLTRLYEQSKNDPDLDMRMNVFKERMLEFAPHVRETWLAMQAESYRMPFVAELYKDILSEESS